MNFDKSHSQRHGHGVKMTTTLVIPAYNEDAAIASCLDHALAQTQPFDRIVVVDNKSTDRTAETVLQYAEDHPQVELIDEARQGVLYARTTGFNAADSDVIARIDADTRLRPEWCATGLSILAADEEARIGAVSGFTVLYESPFQNYSERQLRKKYPGVRDGTIISGNNTMIRREAWEACRDNLSGRTDIHEDGELGVWIRRKGWKLMLAIDMMTDVSPRRFGLPPWKSMGYYLANVRTHKVAGDPVVARRLALVMPVVFVWSIILWPLYGAWDPSKKRWSLRLLLAGEHRPSPLVAE